MNEFRNQDLRKRSRKIILGRLKIYGQAGTTVAVILKTPYPKGGPWSEDLQDLIREGLAESHEPADKLSMASKVRITESK